MLATLLIVFIMENAYLFLHLMFKFINNLQIIHTNLYNVLVIVHRDAMINSNAKAASMDWYLYQHQTDHA